MRSFLGSLFLPGPASGRVIGLDGLRGLTALYVVLFHCWLISFPGFPLNSGPGWLEWLMYGRLGVVFFLALSGFSLALSPAASGWRLPGITAFARRRAWRIVPPYWAALLISLLIGWWVVPASHFGPPSGASVIVYGLLLQDLITAPTPNGAFWSIAVEAELYVSFPLLLLLRRRLGAVGLPAVVLLPVLAWALLANATPQEGMNQLAPNLAPIFVAGIVGAGVVTAREQVRRLPWLWLSATAGVPVLALIIARGPVWTANHYFWIDLAVAPSMVCLIVAVAVGRPSTVQRLVGARPVRFLGSISYSVYLIHLPVVMVVGRKLVLPQLGPGLPAFWWTSAVGLALSVPAAWLFALAFELPFQRTRSWAQLIAPALGAARRLRRHAGGGASQAIGHDVDRRRPAGRSR